MSAFTHDGPGTTVGRWRSHPSWTQLPDLRLGHAVARLVVVAAHPDDEALGAGGLLATAHDRGVEAHVVLLTDGDASHPRSSTHDPARLAAIRRREAQAAVHAVAPQAHVVAHGFGDGTLVGHEHDVVRLLVDLVGDGRDALLVAPWRHDGHPDHEAAGRATAAAAARTGAGLLEYPIWFWHWASPETAPWPDLVQLELDDDQQRRKQQAIAAHRSQVSALSDEPGDEVLLTPGFLEHFVASSEIYLQEEPTDSALDDLHAREPDPWGVDERWYERRKRRLVGAMLPRPGFRRALEIGCSTGALASDLAPRCDELVAVDSAAHAVAAARERLAGLDHVRVERRDVPGSWPEGVFDLVVVSEVGYFLSPSALEQLVERMAGSLADDAVIVLAHWRHPVVGWILDGVDVHEHFRAAGLRPELATYRDRDVEVLLLGAADLAPDPGA